jgi:hypothetical protein
MSGRTALRSNEISLAIARLAGRSPSSSRGRRFWLAALVPPGFGDTFYRKAQMPDAETSCAPR